MLLPLLTSFVPTLACVSATAARTPSLALAPAVATRSSDPFPTPATGLKIQVAPGEEMSLDKLLDEFSRVTGQNLLVSNDTCSSLRNVPTGLNRSVEIPASEVYSFVENVLAHNQYALEVLSDHEPRLLAVHNLATRGRNNQVPAADLAHYVPVKDIGLYANHAAVLVSTMLELPSTDVRTLSNSMRALTKDAVTQQLIAIGNTNSLILSGSGASVANLVTILREGDESARKAQVARDQRVAAALVAHRRRRAAETAAGEVEGKQDEPK
jgi:type II secretory pathway component GspD/PulD (secretin)